MMYILQVKLAWATDIHLDCASKTHIQDFLDGIKNSGADKLVVTGDISQARKLKGHLQLLGETVETYFVLGNHDFYGSVVEGRSLTPMHEIRAMAKEVG